MGKWTPDYLDDVLRAKIRTLVSGAVKRSSFEKTEPMISFENFVNDLDTGDSFTTSIIDVLVKELADRRTRPSPNDRRLISDSSANSLRLLTTPLRIYHERPAVRHFGRRSINLSEYLTATPNEMDMDEDEDEFDSMLDNQISPLEGVRMNSELFDAYSTRQRTGSLAPRRELARMGRPSPPPTIESVFDDLPLATGSADVNEGNDAPLTTFAPLYRSGPWSMQPTRPSTTPPATASDTIIGPSSSTALTQPPSARQPSIRRPIRSRTVDFNDFTSRRRSTIRDTLGGSSAPVDPALERERDRARERDIEREEARERMVARRLASWSASGSSLSSGSGSSSISNSATRRFFPFSRRVPDHIRPASTPVFEAGPSSWVLARLGQDHHDSATSAENIGWGAEWAPERAWGEEEAGTGAGWFLTFREMSERGVDEGSDRAASEEHEGDATPRLRRGDVRAPEVLAAESSVAAGELAAPSVEAVLPREEEENSYPTPGESGDENPS
ncbi:hypothetical protein BD779DRAFT_1465878 [Infundibulicybe gibba]|nr:hypothetical protein BD779DRAFT_1465878 [Infundibulicybe gibba]